MARVSDYKQYNPRNRRAVLEESFEKGMMSTNGIVDDGYLRSLVNFTFEKEGKILTPRPGLDLSSVVFLSSSNALPDDDDYFSANVTVKASQECVEQGKTYAQVILGKLDEEDESKGRIWVSTNIKETDPTRFDVFSEAQEDISYADSTAELPSHSCYYCPVADQSGIHKWSLDADGMYRIDYPIGAFAYTNHYYFMGEDSDGNSGLYRTVFDPSTEAYKFEHVVPKDVSVSEAVTYGYNMLQKEGAYTFNNQHASPIMQFEGILPYDAAGTTLLMTPKKNQPVRFKAYYNVVNGRKFDIVWEWRETTSSEWTLLQRDIGVTFGDDTVLEAYFQPPAVDMMLRVAAYPYVALDGAVSDTPSDTVEKAMVVGFDFTVEHYGTATSVDQKVYDLTTANGMAFWNGRLAIWGLPEDPTILFLSDYNEPAYFPYPNNITVFDAPIIYAVEFMDVLMVFTTDKLYSVTLADDGNSWQTTVIQSHLHIAPWDRHLIRTVRNMLYFKSGNYYYMMVPKAQSQTGELTLAPITTPITSFFDNFKVNVRDLFKSTYGDFSDLSLLTYYNLLDYEDVHNLYVFSFNETSSVVNFDIIYNTVDRTWKIWIFETPNILYPYKQDATQAGVLATTSIISSLSVRENNISRPKRIIQLFQWNKLFSIDYYLPDSSVIIYYPEEYGFPYVDGNVLVDTEVPMLGDYVGDGVFSLWYPIIFISDGVLNIPDGSDFFAGFDKRFINFALTDVLDNLDKHYTFKNYQFLDTGYRNDELQLNKRYRELQLQINNLDQENLDFGMEFLLDGAPRKVMYKYHTVQAIDEFDPEYGVVYVDTVPYMETVLDDIDLTNQWTLDQGLMPEVTLWKCRIAISGKGSAPRFKLYSRNYKRFELLGVNWISKIMHMR